VTIPRFDFSFSNPGARSQGFGGAFAALADDATAAYANPAGLVQLTDTEVSLEARLWGRSPEFIAGGRADGTAGGMGQDTTNGLLFGEDSSRDFGPSFTSLVIPRERWSFAVYGHRLANFEQTAESQGFFFDDSPPPGAVGRFPGTQESIDLKVSTAGFAAAWRASDMLSFGLAVVFSDVTLTTSSSAFAPDDETTDSFFGPITFLPERRIASSFLDVEGTDISFNAGILYRPTEQISLAAFHRQGAEADGDARFETGPLLGVDLSFRNDARFEVPDVTGAGIAYRSLSGRITLAAEVDRVDYEGLVTVQSSDDLEVDGREFRNAWDYHVGAEYALLQAQPIIALRAGYWVESNGQDINDASFHHFAAGLGLAGIDLSKLGLGGALQVDLGADFSSQVDTLSLSMIYTF
jgi:long-subunit fatty acid transport protein